VLGFSFPLSGGYENLRTFLARLEALDQFLIVREVALRGGREGGTALELSVNVETYFNAPDLRDQLTRERGWRDQQRRRGARPRGR
jgi:Tfp pilus assembly protein PilO